MPSLPVLVLFFLLPLRLPPPPPLYPLSLHDALPIFALVHTGRMGGGRRTTAAKESEQKNWLLQLMKDQPEDEATPDEGASDEGASDERSEERRVGKESRSRRAT